MTDATMIQGVCPDRFAAVRDALQANFDDAPEGLNELAARFSVCLDGEVVVVGAEGRTSFKALQDTLGDGAKSALSYFAFDLLQRGGEDTSRLPLVERKARLALSSVSPTAAATSSTVRPGHFSTAFRHRKRLELASTRHVRQSVG